MTRVRRWLHVFSAVAFCAVLAAALPSDGFGQPQQPPGYDGRFTFVRLRWTSDLGSSRRGGFGAAWNHDYPRAERHLSLILEELTALDIRADDSLLLTLDDPELFNHPIAFMWEPGFWNLTDREATAFRVYLQKGGFAVFEDFDGPQQWSHFEAQMRRVLPEGRWVRLDNAHPIFNSFFHVKDID